MLTLKSLFAFCLAVIAILFISCSDNSTNTNVTTPTNNDSLMYSFDSLVLYANNSAHINAYYLHVDSCKFTKYRIQCSFTSNDTSTILDSANSFANVSLTNNGDTTGGYYKLKIGKDINGYTINDVANLSISTPFRLVGVVYLSFVNYPSNPNIYIRAKNFKLYKTS